MITDGGWEGYGKHIRDVYLLLLLLILVCLCVSVYDCLSAHCTYPVLYLMLFVALIIEIYRNAYYLWIFPLSGACIIFACP